MKEDISKHIDALIGSKVKFSLSIASSKNSVNCFNFSVSISG